MKPEIEVTEIGDRTNAGRASQSPPARRIAKAPIRRFEDLEVWKEGMQLAVQVYEAMKDSRDLGLKGQMQRAAVSIPSNIAEGYERGSNREFVQFLHYAKGSCGELRTQIYLAAKAGQVGCPAASALIEKTQKDSAMLHKYAQVRKRDF